MALQPGRRREARGERVFVDTLLAALLENAEAHNEELLEGGITSRGPIWENPWDDLPEMRVKLHQLGTILKKLESYGLSALICEMSLVVWQLRAWFTLGAGFLVIEILKRISEMSHRLPSTDGADPGLAALRVIEGFVLFCAARHKKLRKDATAALERVLVKKRLPPCTSVRIESALVSVGWQKNLLTKPPLSDTSGEDWLNELAMALKPNAEAEARMENTRHMLETVVRNLFPGARCDYFGSAVNGFETRLSDIDAVIVFTKDDMERLAQQAQGSSTSSASPALKAAHPSLKGMALSRRLQKESAAVAVRTMGEALARNEEWGLEVKEMVTEARVPVLKCTSSDGVAIDITFNNLLPLYNSKLLKAYASLDDRVARLGRLVKFWAKSRMVNDALEGTLSSYSHCLLLVHFLQSISLLPNLQDKEASGMLDAAERAKYGETELFEGVHDVWFLDPGRLPRDSKHWRAWASKSPAGATLRGLLANFFWYLAYEVPAHSDVLSIRLSGRVHKEVYFREMLLRKRALGQESEPVLEPLDPTEVEDACEDDPHGENDDKEAEPAEHEEHHEEHEAEHELHEEHREDREIPEQTAEVRFPAPSEPPEDLAQKYRLPPEQHELQQAMSTRQVLCIDDPMELGRSLGVSFQGFERLCFEWRRAHHMLSEARGDDLQRLKALFSDKSAPPRSIYNLEKQRNFPELIGRADRRREEKWNNGRSWYPATHYPGKGEPGTTSTAYPGWRGQKGAGARAPEEAFHHGVGKDGRDGKEGKEGGKPKAKGLKGQAEGKGLWQ